MFKKTADIGGRDAFGLSADEKMAIDLLDRVDNVFRTKIVAPAEVQDMVQTWDFPTV
ncbi:MAG TPA: hypothetical protein VFQ60_02490 [Patescibacteria group bacterium]|nr:hypothetical protein [Patescibacteria group bacterium]